MTRTLLLLIIIYVGMISPARAQHNQIAFSYEYPRANDSDKIVISVQNKTANKTLYYFISLDGLTDTGWTRLRKDIRMDNSNGWVVPQPVKPNTIVKREVSKKRMFDFYHYKNISHIRFRLNLYQTKWKSESCCPDTVILAPVPR